MLDDVKGLLKSPPKGKNLEVIVVDTHDPRLLNEKITQRLNEQLAEKTSNPTQEQRQEVEAKALSLVKWLQEPVCLKAVGQVQRYWWLDPATHNDSYPPLRVLVDETRQDIDLGSLHFAGLADKYRIVVYAATGPERYPEVLGQWSAYAERIALEKPVAGLMEQHGRLARQRGLKSVRTTDVLRVALRGACRNSARPRDLPPLQVVTVDHYNAKWAVAAIEWLRRRGIADRILRRPRRICIQILEADKLPPGRIPFYDLAGGTLPDMLPHLMQPVRALAGYPNVSALLNAMRVVRVWRAQYEGSGLKPQTETFGAFHLEFIGPPWQGTPVYILTGKGVTPESKTIAVEAYDDDGPQALVCDIKDLCIRFHGVNRHEVWLETVEHLTVPGPGSFPLLGDKDHEYPVVLNALCDHETPDPRCFPPVLEAAEACDFFYLELLRSRIRGEPLRLYKADVANVATGSEALQQWLEDGGFYWYKAKTD
jgi:hypothetical protein